MADASSSPPFPYVIPDVRFVRPCQRIQADAGIEGGIIKSIADVWRMLTDPLPLQGGPAMRRLYDGRLKLVADVRDSAPWLAPGIDQVEEQLELRAWAGQPWLALRPMILTGPPGCGKSNLARLLAEAAGVGLGTLDLGGTSGARTLEGTARGWNSAQPCYPATLMAQTLSANPVLLLEEVDKAGGSASGGDPLAVLLTMVRRSTASGYHDKSLMAPFDLSHIVWIATANRVDRLPRPLLSRFDMVEVIGTGPEHPPALVHAPWHRCGRDLGVTPAMTPVLDPEIEDALVAGFGTSRSVRRLARAVEAVLAAVVRLTRYLTH